MKKLVTTALLVGSLLAISVPASQAATTKPTTKPSVAGRTAGGDDKARNAEFKAFRDCLVKHGVTAPAFGKPGAGVPGTAGAAGTAPKLTAKAQKAEAACASLRPKGGFGEGFKVGGTAFAAFTSCMKDHKVTIPVPNFAAKPTPAAKATGSAKPSLAPSAGGQERGREGFLSSLNQKDPKVAAALKICGALLPAQH
ncbi:hypothetical protein GALL_415820 [mine drainage metagenome]|uniref:Uncharacterized protein n=1 Tax=mine drainage metagenome TaxID=410659 RepID=A0A1J5QGU3_9ZZZZ